jgi:MtN3 and saliva related transmembrane protein
MAVGHFLSDCVGVAAAACSMASFIPQATKILKDHDASSVSLRMYIVTVVGFALWTSYGFLLRSWPLIGSNLVSLGLSGAILSLKLRYKNGGESVEEASRSSPRRGGGPAGAHNSWRGYRSDGERIRQHREPRPARKRRDPMDWV